MQNSFICYKCLPKDVEFSHSSSGTVVGGNEMQQRQLFKILRSLRKLPKRPSVNELLEVTQESRASFYRKYATSDVFYHTLAKSFSQHVTNGVIARLEHLRGADALQALAELLIKEDLSSFDFYIRTWVGIDPHLDAILQADQAQRAKQLTLWFKQAGFTNREGQWRVAAFATYMFSEHYMLTCVTKKTRLNNVRKFINKLTETSG